MKWRHIFGLVLAAYTAPLSAETLSLQQAFEKIQGQNRPLKAAEIEMQMRLAEAWQAGLLPNPLLSVEADDFGGNHYYRGFKHAQYSLSLTQPVDLSGKRSARRDVALAGVYKACYDYEILRQRLLRDLKMAFVNAAAMEERLKIACEQRRIAQDKQESAAEKTASGKGSFLQQQHATIACQASHMAYGKANSDLRMAYDAIAALLNEPCVTFTGIDYPFYEVGPLPPYQAYESALENNPELASAQVDTYGATRIHQLERANRIPDLDVTASVCNYHDDGGNSFAVELSIPIPIFDRNDGNICRSSWQTWQARYAQEDLAITLKRRLRMCYESLKQSYDLVASLQAGTGKCAKEALETTRENYRLGKAERHEWLDAQRICCEIRDQYIESLREYHLKRIELENIAPSGGF